MAIHEYLSEEDHVKMLRDISKMHRSFCPHLLMGDVDYYFKETSLLTYEKHKKVSIAMIEYKHKAFWQPHDGLSESYRLAWNNGIPLYVVLFRPEEHPLDQFIVERVTIEPELPEDTPRPYKQYIPSSMIQRKEINRGNAGFYEGFLHRIRKLPCCKAACERIQATAYDTPRPHLRLVKDIA